MKRFATFFLFITLSLFSMNKGFAAEFSLVKSPYTVSFHGCVENKQPLLLNAPVRLFSLLDQAQPTDCAFLKGSYWLDPALIPQQTALKNKLQTQIKSLVVSAEQQNNHDLTRHLRILLQQVNAMPVTGRHLPSELTPYLVETRPYANRLLTSEAFLYFPREPRHVNFIGFRKPEMLYFSTQSLSDYVGKNDLKPFYERGWVYHVLPNGKIEYLKVGYWTHDTTHPAPGSVVVGKLDASVFRHSDDIDFDQETYHRTLTQWLATQVLPL
ncbi:MAG: capsule biosynthesis GfcC family protein [Hydrogenovibrio sp.]|uniref:capsule biosynthesis GfcC D2 domain-containing protein n=1 Tax=Hydrogenovibrio sp. TaxID=2065821 RepID=UPI00286FBDA5|nr:capsule biosynthesis GfcC D2 domain-containing protein [Hydrogenovibrio sp.]MDR9500075.1 capsule biosynthesis GfcC family protein [Hydrogenovibrio sp.]